MIDARTLLLAAQTRSECGQIIAANLLREAARTISSLRTALRLARAQIAAERDALILCHGIDGVIPATDREGLAGVADLDAVLAQIDEALK